MEKLDREPTDAELAAALDIEMAELAAFQAMSQPRQVVSLDDAENTRGEDSVSLGERLADAHAPRPDAAVLAAEDRDGVVRCIGALPKTQATVIVLHYLQDVPLRDIADTLHVTPSRISQLHHQALARLRSAWKREQKSG